MSWYVPAAGMDARSLGDAVQLLGSEPAPATVVQVISTFLKERAHLVPKDGESLAITIAGTDSIVAAVLGEASLVVWRAGVAKAPRHRGVVRLETDPDGTLELEVLAGADDQRRPVIRITQMAIKVPEPAEAPLGS